MAYMSQERKAQIAPKVKAIMKKYGIKGSLAVDNHSTLVLNIKSGKIDFIKNFVETVSKLPGGVQRNFGAYPRDINHIQVNTYWYDEHYSGKAKKFLEEVMKPLNEGNFDKSDIQSDYFCVGWYINININIGKWNKPYEVTA